MVLRAVLSPRIKTKLVPLSSLVSILFSLFISPCVSLASQQTAAREISFPVAIQWNKQTGVRRYRIQIATDEKFQDVFFDGRVMGERYVATDLPAGYYFWRVAPADRTLGSYSQPVRFFVSGGTVTTVSLPSRAKRGRSLPEPRRH